MEKRPPKTRALSFYTNFILHQEQDRFEWSCSLGEKSRFFGFLPSGSPPYTGGRAWSATEFR